MSCLCMVASSLLGDPLANDQADRAVLLVELLLDRVPLVFAGLLDVVVLVALAELVLELVLGNALGGLDAPPVRRDVEGAVLVVDHADVVAAHVDRDRGLQLVAAIAADRHRLALLGLGELQLHVGERLLDRRQVRHLERALREVRHASPVYVTARACVPRRHWSRPLYLRGSPWAPRSAPSTPPFWQGCVRATRPAVRASGPTHAWSRSARAS